MAAEAVEAAGLPLRRDMLPAMTGEDFAWYLESVPGALARLGTAAPGQGDRADLHQATFDVDERVIGVGVRLMAATALAALAEGRALAPARTLLPARAPGDART